MVKEFLSKCEKATQEVGQRYTITTFDLGDVMKALPIIWHNPAEFKNRIILIGAFHTIMNYMNMLGHKMAGSGYSELIFEANLLISGCLKGVLRGKNYSKSMWCLKAFIDQLDEYAHGSTNIDVLDSLTKLCNKSFGSSTRCVNEPISK